MSQYSAIKAATNAYIKSNGMREITGAILNSVMIATINALGKYYQFAGVADRDTDPGSPDENVIYITGTTGTYANFGGIVVNAGEMALLKWDGTWTKQVIKIIPESTSQLLNDSGFITNAVGNLLNYYLKSETYTKGQVDDLIAAVHQFEFVVADSLPTASADTMYKIYLIPAGDSEDDNYKDEYVTILEEGVYSWEKIGSTAVDLSDYPTNEQMAQAIDDAIAAYISSINASVDSNVGTPSVDVSYSSGVLTLAFHNLKGVQGDQGVPGPPGVTSVEASVDNNTGIPSVEASVNAGVLTLTFHNLKGLQGDTGSSVAYPFTLVNNTTTDDPLQALTAAMGKYLQDQLTQLEAEVHNLSGKYYGVHATADTLPDDADAPGYAFVGAENPYAIWNFDGEEWSDSGSVAKGIMGEPGVGFSSIFTPQPYDGTMIIVLSNNDTITVDLNHNHPQYGIVTAGNAQPSGGFLPDIVYKLGTITGSVTFALAAAVTGNTNHYFWTFDTDSTAPTITWPSNITWVSGSAPLIAASKHYEVSILDGIAAILEV